MPPRQKLVKLSLSNEHFNDIAAGWREAYRDNPRVAFDFSIRLDIAKAALGYPKSNRRSLVSAVVERAEKAGEILTPEAVSHALFDSGKESKWIKYVTELLQERFSDRDDPDYRPMFEFEFREKRKFRGPNAPFVFCRRAMGMFEMEHWSDQTHGKRGKFDYFSDARAPIVEAVKRFLDHKHHIYKPCFVVHSSNFPRGLNAFAGRLIEDRYEKPNFEALPRCLLYASPSAPPHRSVDLPHMLRQILAFYGGTTVEKAPAVTDLDVRRDIELVRRNMARYPAIFIVDGVHDTGPDLHDLRTTMLDDPFRLLIKHLLFPDIGSSDEPNAPDLFIRNRFIILSNGPCEWLSPLVAERRELPPAGTKQTAGFIQGDGVYQHGQALKTYFNLRSEDPAAAEEPRLQCLDALLALGVPGDNLPPPGDVAHVLIQNLGASRLHWLLPLTLLLLTPGGLRRETVFRLLEVWKADGVIARADGIALLSNFTLSDLDEFCRTLSSIMVEAEDHTAMDTISRKAADDRKSPLPGRGTISFLTPQTAKIILDALLPKISRLDLNKAHALLATEAMRQHTRAMRLVDRDDHSSIRMNRRLLQALYHGFLALDFAPGADAGPRDSLITITPRERFNRNYALFYRLQLEAPPHWEMARVMSAQGVKRDLLLAALGTNQLPHLRSSSTGANYDIAAPYWLKEDVYRDKTSAAIANDLFEALCHSTLQLNQFDAFARSVKAARELLAATHPNFRSPTLTQKLDKLEIDALILQDRLKEASQLVLNSLRDLRIPRDLLGKARQILRQRHPSRSFPLRALVDQLPVNIRSLSISLLQRRAEILATRADDQLTNPKETIKKRAEHRLFDAHVLFALADEIRRVAFTETPLGRGFVLSGHAVRVQVRVLILLGRCEKEGSAARAEFLGLARRRADSFTRTFARYPAERASMLILESNLARVTDPSVQGLKKALDLIIEADRQSVWAPDRPRLQMRLLFERLKILRRLARSPSDDQEAYTGWIRFDSARLQMLTAQSASAQWIKLASRVIQDSADANIQARGRPPRRTR